MTYKIKHGHYIQCSSCGGIAARIEDMHIRGTDRPLGRDVLENELPVILARRDGCYAVFDEPTQIARWTRRLKE